MNKYFPSIVSAILMGVSQQPWGFGFLAWFSLVPFIAKINQQSSFIDLIKHSFIWSFLYHLIFFFWISDNIGLDSQILRYLIMLLVVIVLTINIILIYGIYFYFKKYFKSDNIIYILPVIIVSIEYVRSLGFYGSVWNSLSYTQIDYLLISQNIEYTGIFGLTFWIVLINIMILKVYNKINSKNIILLLCFFIFPWITGYIIKSNHINDGSKLNVKLVQPNVSLFEKRQSLKKSLNKLINLSLETSNEFIDLIIWPESSISGLFFKDNRYNSNLSLNMNNFLKSNQFSLVAGSDIKIDGKRYNSSLLFKSDSIIDMFHKQRLVPNVERTPSFFNKIGLDIGISNFDIGTKLTMFSINDVNFASMICIESVFPDITRNFVNNGAEFITYIVNDGWYPRNPQLDQHAQRCIYRAIENRRYVIRTANTGVTMVIDSYGNIVDKLEFNKEGVLEAEINTYKEKTFYTKYGDLFSIINLFFMLLTILGSFFKGSK
jgi:apolipoprotein N-acyltransferase